MKIEAKTRHKYLKLIISLILFLFLTIGVIFSGFITKLFYVIYFLFIPFLALYVLKYMFIPVNRIDVEDNNIIFKWAKVGKSISRRIEVPVEAISLVTIDTEHILVVQAFDGVKIIMAELKDARIAMDQLNELLPDSKNISQYVEDNDLAKIDNFHSNFYCHFLFLYLLKMVRLYELPDEIFDVYLFLKFFNDFINGRVQFFIISHYQYIQRVKGFMNNLNLGWIPTYVDNILKVQPQFDENYIKNLKDIFNDEASFSDFNNIIIENASQIMKVDQDGNMLICQEIERYCRENDIIKKIQDLKLEEKEYEEE